MITVTLFGSGNIATHLYSAFKNSKKVLVKQWYSRNLQTILNYKNEVLITNTLANLIETNLYILAISDDAIAEFSSKLPPLNGLVVHTSGSVGIHDLDKKHRRGVFYLLQTFSKDAAVDFNTIPICIEALEKEDYTLLNNVAKSISNHVYKINTEQRQTLHLAAVFVNNFTNQLYRVAHEITDAKNIPFDVLKPLILETAVKVQTLSPYMAQTGPAKRNDKKTIKKHLKQLDNPAHKALYELLTQQIQKTHGKR